MNLKLLALTFLILSLAVTPAYATPSYNIHSTVPVWITHRDPYTEGPTVWFGGGSYVWTDWNDLRITSLFVDDASYTWFNYTVDFIYSGADQKIYCAFHTVTSLYVNDVLYLEDHPSVFCYWYESLGIVYVFLGGVSRPANVSIAYEIPPPAETVAITIDAFDYNDSSSITAGSVMVDDLIGNQTTFTLPTVFSVLKGYTYEITAYSTADWTFDHWTYFGAYYTNETTIRLTFEYDTDFGVFYNAVTVGELLPVPIIFIFGMVGLACMFVGPIYGINKIKQHEYRHGLVWAVIITALGFSLFIAWLFGGVF